MISWFIKLFNKRNKKDSVLEGVNVVESIGKAKSLYKELIKQAHPDRHPNREEYYQELTDRINANRYNYIELVKIKPKIRRRKTMLKAQAL